MEPEPLKRSSEDIFDASTKLRREAAADSKSLSRLSGHGSELYGALALLIAYQVGWFAVALVTGFILFKLIVLWLNRKPQRQMDEAMELMKAGARARHREFTAVQRAQGARALQALVRSEALYSERLDGRIEVVAADLGDDSTVVEVMEWLVEPRQSLKEGQPIANVLYDSWTLEFVAPSDCRVEQLLVPASTEAPVGAPLCILTPGLGPSLNT